MTFRFPPTNTTNAAFIQNAMALEDQGGLTQYFNLPEVEMADRLCGGHQQVSVLLRKSWCSACHVGWRDWQSDYPCMLYGLLESGFYS